MKTLPDSDFSPNSQRSIRIQGEFDQALLDRLTPRIYELTRQSPAAITVWIDSDGGNSAVGRRILDLLRSTNQGGGNRCRLITIGYGKAKSAAALLLSAGDWAIAHPETALLYHASRFATDKHVTTAKQAMLIAENFRILDDLDVLSLARNSARRFVFLLFALRAEVEKYHNDSGDPSTTSVRAFQEILRSKLSPQAKKVLERAVVLCDRRANLFDRFQKTIGVARPANKSELEKLMFDVSVGFERETGAENDRDWSLGGGGLLRINRHFSLLNLYFQSADGDLFSRLCDDQWVRLILSVYEPVTLTDQEMAEKLRAYSLPFWAFFVSLCRALCEGENELTPTDCLWLGLIDSVRPDIGDRT